MNYFNTSGMTNQTFYYEPLNLDARYTKINLPAGASDD